MWPMRMVNADDCNETGTLEALRGRLLRAGLPCAYVQRYVGELHEHRRELIDDAQHSGASLPEAEHIADARLGHADQLATACIRTARRATFAGRHPWLIFATGAFFAVPTSFLAIAMLTVALIGWGVAPPPDTLCGWLWRTWGPRAFLAADLLLPALLVIVFDRAIRRRMLGRKWRAGIGAFLCFMGAACTIGAHINPSGHGNLWVAMSLGKTALQQAAALLLILSAVAAYSRWSRRDPLHP